MVVAMRLWYQPQTNQKENLQKSLVEQVGFQGGSKSRVRGCRTDRERERIPDRGRRKGEGAFTERPRNTGSTECEVVGGGAKCSLRSIYVYKLREVGRSRSIYSLVAQTCDLILNACFDRQPVESVQVWGYVIPPGNPQHKPSC